MPPTSLATILLNWPDLAVKETPHSHGAAHRDRPASDLCTGRSWARRDVVRWLLDGRKPFRAKDCHGRRGCAAIDTMCEKGSFDVARERLTASAIAIAYRVRRHDGPEATPTP